MDFAQLALICLVAIVGPLLSVPRGLHVPVIIGELAVGLILGRTGLDAVDAADPAFALLAQIGFVLVMFVAGSSVHLGSLGRSRTTGLALARAVLVGVLAIPAGLLIANVTGTGHGALYAVLIASSSASLILPSLGGVPLEGPVLAPMVAQVAVADAACIIALPLVLDRSHVLRAMAGVVLVVVGAGLAFLVLRRVEETGARRAVHEVSEERRLALELRVLLTLLFALAALAQAMSVSTMLAGFALGIAVARVGEPRRVAKQFFALTEGFFGPVFFVWLGAGIDLRALAGHPRSLLLGLLLPAAALACHGLMVLTRQPLPVALMTAAQMGVPVAAVALTAQSGQAAPGEGAAILLGALLTVAATALLAGRVRRLAQEGPPGAAP